MLEALARHPNANAVLAPVLDARAAPSHAYLFHGPGGSGKRTLARELAATLLAQGAVDPASAQARALAGTHPDLTWVSPSGAHEILVSDIDQAVVAAAGKTPFEATRRVFVIESVEQLGAQAANRMLKTLEEPPAFVHLILITERLGEVLETIRSRCQAVRFNAPGTEQLAAELVAAGTAPETAGAYARLGLGDADRARALCDSEGAILRERAQLLVRLALAGQASASAPWTALLETVRARGQRVKDEIETRGADDALLYPTRERKRVEGEWSERAKRARRRAEQGALDMALSLAESWLLDLAALGWGAEDLIRNRDLIRELEADTRVGRGADVQALCRAVELVEDTRARLPLNVSEELACEALGYRLEQTLAA